MKRRCCAFAGLLLFAISSCSLPHVRSKVIGGKNATKPYPFMASIAAKPEEGAATVRGFCGGTLVAKNVVVTAVHCVDGFEGPLVVGLAPLHYNIPVKQTVPVKAVLTHPQFSSTDALTYDVAVLVLEDYDPHSLGVDVQPIPLNRDDHLPEAQGSVLVLGFGNGTSQDGGWLEMDNLQEVSVPTVPLDQCNTAYDNQLIHNAHFCAGEWDHGGIDSCQGDSGGPVLVQQNGQLALAGAVSFGEGCGLPQKPGVYARISSASDWIDSIIAQYAQPQTTIEPSRLYGLVNAFCYTQLGAVFDSIIDPSQVFSGRIGYRAAGTMQPVTSHQTGESYATCHAIIPGTDHDFDLRAEVVATATTPLTLNVTFDNVKYAAPAAVTSSKLSGSCQMLAANDSTVGADIYGDNMTFFDGHHVLFNQQPYQGELTALNKVWECSSDSVTFQLYQQPHTLDTTEGFVGVASSKYLATQLPPYQLKIARTHVATLPSLTLSSNDKHQGVLFINNPDNQPIFSWELACNKSFDLLINQVWQTPARFLQQYQHRILVNQSPLGTIPAQQSIQIPFTAKQSLEGIRCQFNSNPAGIQWVPAAL